MSMQCSNQTIKKKNYTFNSSKLSYLFVSAGIGLSACATAPSAQPATVAELTAQCEGLGGVLVPRQRDARRGQVKAILVIK